MTTLTRKLSAHKITFDDDNFWVHLADVRILGVPFAYFPKLMRASKPQLDKYEISGGGSGLHWDELDEDISVEQLVLGFGDQTKPKKHAS
jgi:hypothetical protein